MNLNTYIDHTLLKPVATETDIENLCSEAADHKFFSVCVNSAYVSLAGELLSGSNTVVCTVVGFPLGAMSAKAKAVEAETALAQGAAEIDMVINIGFLKSENHNAVRNEIRELKHICRDRILKVIIETCYLDEREKQTACKLAVDAGADFVKTSTGFGPGGATIEDVTLMKQTVGDNALVKASGGIKNRADAEKFIEAGASRLGTSNGIAIISGSEGSGY